MGRRSDSDDDRSRRRRKDKSRSRSRSRDSNYSNGSRSKHKKSKKKHRRRSYSRSPRPRRRTRSRSRERRSRSRSYDRRLRSGSRDRRRSRSMSRERSRRRRSRSKSYSRSPSRKADREPGFDIEGYDKMTDPEKAKARMKMALKAAAAVDEDLNRRVVGGLQLSVEEQLARQKKINSIENSGFVQHSFKSSRNDPSDFHATVTHDSTIFGKTSSTDIKLGDSVDSAVIDIAHPRLHVGADVKMEKWRQKLTRIWQQASEVR